MTIFDMTKAQAIAAYWDAGAANREPYIGEALFPSRKKLGLSLDWIKGGAGLPVVLKASAFDVKAIPRDRIGIEKVSKKMPFFKESMLIDEELRQQLNMLLESNDQVAIRTILTHIFDDTTTLLEAARAQRERMRMMLLTTGVIAMESNGQRHYFDYQLDEAQLVTSDWSNPQADIIGDIRRWKKNRRVAKGVELTRALTNSTTWEYIMQNERIKSTIFVLGNGNQFVDEDMMRAYLLRVLKIRVELNDKLYKDETGEERMYVPDGTFVLLPDGDLGNTWFGTTPEESDLRASAVANVAIVDMGVAITTTELSDPVTTDTKVSMICLPSFPQADRIMIADVIPETPETP